MNHFAVYLQLTRHCKSTILQRKILKLKNPWDGMGREVGGGFRMGNTQIHVDVWQNQYNIVK